MEDNIFDDNSIAINQQLFDSDYDDVGFEPTVVRGDDDEEAAIEYGY